MVQFLPIGLSIIASLALASSASTGITCTVAQSSTDDAITIAEAFENCKDGGTVVFPRNTTYFLQSPLAVQDLSHVTVKFHSQIIFPVFNAKFKNGNPYISIKGDHINFSGGGTIVGNGQTWWDIKDLTAPNTFSIVATNSDFGNFNIINSPRYHFTITNSSDVVLHDINWSTISNNNFRPKNTDGLDVYYSKNIVFKDSTVLVGDDCVAVKAGVTNMTVSNVHCTNGHGFSIGSLGLGGVTDYVKDVNIVNSVCTNCDNGVRIKTWRGGKGAVQNIKFKKVKLLNTDNPIAVTAHYCDITQVPSCAETGDNTSLSISGVTFDDITGSVSTSNSNPIINVNCSSGSHCSDFRISGVKITKDATTPTNICEYLDGSDKISVCGK